MTGDDATSVYVYMRCSEAQHGTASFKTSLSASALTTALFMYFAGYAKMKYFELAPYSDYEHFLLVLFGHEGSTPSDGL